jgi:hypothetical protein
MAVRAVKPDSIRGFLFEKHAFTGFDLVLLSCNILLPKSGISKVSSMAPSTAISLLKTPYLGFEEWNFSVQVWLVV